MPEITEPELERELSALAETPDPDFERELAGRVRSGFPRERARRLSLPALPRLRRPPLPLLAGAASLLLAAAVAVPLLSSDDGGTVASRDGERPRAAEVQSRDSAGAGVGEPLTLSPSPPRRSGDFEPGVRERRIERSATLTIAAPADQLGDAGARVATVTDRHGGFVLRSSVNSGGEGISGGSFELRIPAARLQPALTDLARLGTVRSRSQSGDDVTRGFATASDRLEAARSERRGLRRRLESAPDDRSAQALRDRLDRNAAEIRGLRSQLRDLRLRTEYAAITVTLIEEGAGATPGPGDDGLGGALDDALESLSDIAEGVIRAAGVVVPLGLLAGAIAFGGRTAVRRRREATLG